MNKFKEELALGTSEDYDDILKSIGTDYTDEKTETMIL